MRYWSILFALAAVFSVGGFRLRALLARLVAAQSHPASPTTSISTFGREIDSLFLIILWITGIVFIGTQIVLVWVAYRFVDVDARAGRPRPVLPRQPAARGDLDDHPGGDPRLHRPLPDGHLGEHQVPQRDAPRCQPLAEITGRQFQWVMRYPGPDGKLNTARRPVHRQRPALRQEQAALIYLQVVATCSTRSTCRSSGSSRTPCPA